MNARLRRGLTAFGALAVVLGAPAIGLRWTGARDAAATAKKAAPRALEPTRIANDFVGVLLPPQMANLSPRSDGRVLRVMVKLGQAVKAGDILLQFDDREKREELAMAKAQLKTAKADAWAAAADSSAARKRASRRNASIDVGGRRIALVSGEEAAQAQSDAQSAAARAASAASKIAEQKAKVEQLRLALEETEIRAPFDGVVTGVYFEPGTTVHPGDVVARVVGGGRGLRARIAVPEEAAVLLARRRARLSIDDKTLFATIDSASHEVEPTSRAFLLEGTVELQPGSCGGDCIMLAGRAVRATLLDQ
jgi:RND family efflux transporter MFP subunit